MNQSSSNPIEENPGIDPTQVNAWAQSLLQKLVELESCIVAYSGGVDSAVVAAAAQQALGARALAVTATSPSMASAELSNAIDTAQWIGIRHRMISTAEHLNPNYVKNDRQRCYHCKTELYRALDSIRMEEEARWIVNGTNLDDRSDYRPGLVAADEYDVKSPLSECGLNKASVRAIAKLWQLPIWNKPASPCLSSRIAYGEPVTLDRLKQIEQAEDWLHHQGVSVCRVRWHSGNLARIEVGTEDFNRLVQPSLRTELESKFRQLGFQFVTLDLGGFRSGSLNSLIGIGDRRLPS